MRGSVERIVTPQKAVQIDQQGHFVLIAGEGDVVERRNIEQLDRLTPKFAARLGSADPLVAARKVSNRLPEKRGPAARRRCGP